MTCSDAYDHAEEAMLSACVAQANVSMANTRDARGREHYAVFRWTDHLYHMKYNKWDESHPGRPRQRDWFWQGKDPANDLNNSIAEFPVVECVHTLREEVVGLYQRLLLHHEEPKLDLRSLLQTIHGDPSTAVERE